MAISRTLAPSDRPAAEPTPTRLGVVVVEPALTARAALAMLIGTQADLEVVGQAAGGSEGLQAVRRVRRRAGVVVLVSLAIGGERDAFWLIRQVRERCPQYVIAGCGTASARIAISRALFVGADGYLDTSAPPEEFLDGLRRAGRGEIVLT